MAKLDKLFELMIETDASDLHLMQDEVPKMRTYGVLKPLAGWDVLGRSECEEMLREICLKDRWEHFQKNLDLDFAYAFGDIARFRVNYYNQIFGMGAVFRIIPREIKTLDDLRAPEILKDIVKVQKGLILVTGPTGSGKSTTLAAMINHINENYSKKILTIEEPVEFIHPNKSSIIVQREVGIDCPSFSQGVYDAIRSDVDIIMVGEMRDLNTISQALSAAEKGILVFGTLHTYSAAKTVDRIVDTFPADQHKQVFNMLAESLTAVCSQLLAKTKDRKGRVALHEILVRTLSSSNLIRSGETNKLVSVIQGGANLGMISMDDSISKMLKIGIITKEEAYMKANDKDRFEYEDEDSFL